MSSNDPVTDEVLAANTRFYEALSQANLAAMEDLWHHSQATECIHPGWDRLRGWPAIRQSWARIFEHQGPAHVQPCDPLVHWWGDVAWVTCYEDLIVREGANLHVSQMLATNVFERQDGRWKMVIHHASPAPSEMYQPRQWQVNLN
jgi:ketosteroid isomerase-like protein